MQNVKRNVFKLIKYYPFELKELDWLVTYSPMENAPRQVGEAGVAPATLR